MHFDIVAALVVRTSRARSVPVECRSNRRPPA
jgi:hypothetical protein